MIQYCMILQDLVMFASSKLLPSHGFAKTLSFPGGRQPPRDFRRSRGSVMTSEKSSANKKFPLLCMKIPYDSCVQGKSTVTVCSHCCSFNLSYLLVVRLTFPQVWSNLRIKPWKNFQHVAAGVELSWAFHIPKCDSGGLNLWDPTNVIRNAGWGHMQVQW